jgi:uncharacterized protein YggE
MQIAGIVLLAGLSAAAQTQDVKYVADTVVVQAEGQFESDPDLATLAFQVSVQDKELRKAYERATVSLNRILGLAERSGLAKGDVSTGSFTVFPIYDWGDRKRKARAYRVESRVTLRVRDFSRIGTLIDDSVEEGLVDFRSLTYSLADEEAAKQHAIAEATRRAEARARAALGDSRKLGTLRYVSVDVQQPIGIVRMEGLIAPEQVMALEMGAARAKAPEVPPMPPPAPEKIRITATVHCVFQMQ